MTHILQYNYQNLWQREINFVSNSMLTGVVKDLAVLTPNPDWIVGKVQVGNSRGKNSVFVNTDDLVIGNVDDGDGHPRKQCAS